MFDYRLWMFGLALGGAATVSASAQGPANLREIFGKLDANGDQVIERSEVPEAALPAFERLLKAADTDGDGKIQGPELRAVMENFRPTSGQMLARFATLDADKDGKVSKTEYKGPEGSFERLDDDKDGFLTREEMLKGAAPDTPASMAQGVERLKAMDANKDGKISKEEFKGLPAMFTRLDRDGDGFIAADEFPKFPPGGAGAGAGLAGGLPPRLRSLDKDNDGFLSKEEFKIPGPMFERVDADSDGKLSPAEAIQFMQGLLTRVRAMDENGDGKVSKEEYKGPEALFDRLDANKDGFISPEDTPAAPGGGAVGKAARKKAAAKKADN